MSSQRYRLSKSASAIYKRSDGKLGYLHLQIGTMVEVIEHDESSKMTNVECEGRVLTMFSCDLGDAHLDKKPKRSARARTGGRPNL